MEGDDNNSGESPAAPKKTLAGLKARVGVTQNRTIRLKGHFRESLIFPAGTIVENYGGRAIIDASRVIPAAAFEPYEGNGVVLEDGIYRAPVTTEVATNPHATNPAYSNTFHCAAWVDEDRLTGHLGGASIEANLAAMKADPGSSFSAHLQGSTHPDPRTGTGGTEYYYYVKLAGGADPRSNGAVIAYAEQMSVGTLGRRGRWTGIEVRRTANKDMTTGGGPVEPGYCDDVIFRDAAIHAMVGGPTHHLNCQAYALPTSKISGGGAYHYFNDQAVNGVSPPSSCIGCYAEGFWSAVYAHGTGVGGDPMAESILVRDLDAHSCAAAVSTSSTADGWTIEGVNATLCGSFVGGGEGDLVRASATRRNSYTSALTGACVGVNAYGNMEIADTDFVFQTSGSRQLYVEHSSGDPYTVDFVNCTTQGV